VRRHRAQAIISVRDTGTGIPRADLDHIFDRFARADLGRSRQAGGFGLGLAIVKAIVDGHGGQVHVESAEGEGTTFELTIPIAPGAGLGPLELPVPRELARNVGPITSDQDAPSLAT
jgi:signal transduction histidine kinase